MQIFSCFNYYLTPSPPPPLLQRNIIISPFSRSIVYRCWWGYNFTSIYWILEGPRLAVLLLNFIFLLNIIRVLVVKLRQSHTSEIEQVRKAVRAAIVLIPLLGITNIINMIEAPLHRTPIEFALWSFTTHFLTSSQGLFIATIYCFLNNEVCNLFFSGSNLSAVYSD